jgi:hypothetical protein
MSDNNIKTVYTQDEVKAMMQACLKGLNASDRLMPPYYRDAEDNSFCRIDDVQEMFSQILRILNAEYNEICKAVETAEREGDNDGEKK